MIEMKPEDIERALYIMQLKIAKEIKDNKLKNYDEFKEKIIKLQQEKDLIYKGDKNIIEKVFREYLKDVKE